MQNLVVNYYPSYRFALYFSASIRILIAVGLNYIASAEIRGPIRLVYIILIPVYVIFEVSLVFMKQRRALLMVEKIEAGGKRLIEKSGGRKFVFEDEERPETKT